ncbi:MAG: 3-isopropylmalate dehydratase large subunit [Caulobacteraceae bacterium]|nr:3-isopropylmalate dehydratase large subunit [Caulobacteraceae bacterium]
MPRAQPLTLVEKIWNAHAVAELGDATTLLHIDRLFLHERSGGRMLQGVAAAGRKVFDPSLVFGTLDHIIDTDPGRTDKTKFPGGPEFIRTFRDGAAAAGVRVFDIGDPSQGIVHVIAPELGVAQPGLTLVCGDSHTCTVGGLGALAWGIGVTEGEHVLSTQCLAARKPTLLRVRFEGRLGPCVTAKDLILRLIGAHGARGGAGAALEFAGSAVRGLSCAARMTLCNMAVEFGAWTGIVAPDDVTIEFVHGRRFAPKGLDWDAALAWWRTLRSDDEAAFDREIVVDAPAIEPQVTWGTSSEQSVGVGEPVPSPADLADPVARASAEKALRYTEATPARPLLGLPIGAAFIGSCTNSRIEDLRAAAAILEGRKVAAGVTAICVPGSTAVKRQAEAEGLDQIFKEAGFQWREAGCSLCFYAGGDSFGPARRVITSTNRNFENRQGPGVRSHLASPLTVAASAVAGAIADPRRYVGHP